jgi:hypothetical protein
MFQIYDFTPDSLKKLNDTINSLLNMNYDQNGKALRPLSIQRLHMTPKSVGTDQIDDKAVGTGQVADGAITATQIAAQTITAAQIAAGTITATQIAARTITSEQIATKAILAEHIAANQLLIGQNVFMAPGATISWLNIDAPSDLITAPILSNTLASYPTSAALNTKLADYAKKIDLQDYVLKNELPDGYTDDDVAAYLTTNHITTYIGPTGLYTGTIAANKITAGNMTFATGYSISFDGTTTFKLRISENSIDSTGSSNRLWLNYADGSEVHIGDGTSPSFGNGDLYCGRIFLNGSLFEPGNATVNVVAKWA